MASAINTVSNEKREKIVTGAIVFGLMKLNQQGKPLTQVQYETVAHEASFLAFTIITAHETGKTHSPLLELLKENLTTFLPPVKFVIEVDRQLKQLPKNLNTFPEPLTDKNTIKLISQHILPKVIPNIKISDNYRCPIKDCRQIFPADGSSVCPFCHRIIRCGKSILGDHDPKKAEESHFSVCHEFATQRDLVSDLINRVSMLDPVTSNPSEAASAADEEPKPLVKTCGECGKTALQLKIKLLKCGKCLNMFYCSQDCQIRHWPTHKLVCQIKDHQR